LTLKNYDDEQDSGTYISSVTKRMYYAAYGLIIALFVLIAITGCMIHSMRVVVRILRYFRKPAVLWSR